jgi:hypothetical protein
LEKVRIIAVVKREREKWITTKQKSRMDIKPERVMEGEGRGGGGGRRVRGGGRGG